MVPSDWTVCKSVEAWLMIDEGGLSKQRRTNHGKPVLCFKRSRSDQTMESKEAGEQHLSWTGSSVPALRVCSDLCPRWSVTGELYGKIRPFLLKMLLAIEFYHKQ